MNGYLDIAVDSIRKEELRHMALKYIKDFKKFRHKEIV